MEEAVVLYPTPAIGHLISMVELGKLLLSHQPSLSIHVLVFTAPYNAGSISPYIDSVSSTIPSIKFHHLPTITLPPITSAHHETLTFESIRLSNPNVRQTLLSISKSHTVHALIMDLFCTAALSVASELGIPGYHFVTSGAAFLAVFLYLPTLHEQINTSFRDLKTFLDIPGVPPILSTDMIDPTLDRNDKAYQCFLDSAIGFRRSSGVIVNTFEQLETRAIKALTGGLCMPNHPTPPLYCIGPLIATEKDRRAGNISREAEPDCLTWLDSQPRGSVVFLCFGSLGLFTKEQLSEIAIGLERSGQRFLWVVRNPPCDNQRLATIAQSDPDLNSLVPHGFLDRTKERGFVMKSWAPQVSILNHNSVGGFVTHCGWNSTLEAMCAGVPLVAWPLYAEQKINRVVLVEEMKVALPMKELEGGFVSAEEVEKRVRELMESEEGKAVRKRMICMKDAAKTALSEGGSSLVALSKLFESWKRG